MWVIATNGEVVNLDNARFIYWSGTGGDVRVSFSDTTFVTVTFGASEAEATDAIARLTAAVDPANYVV